MTVCGDGRRTREGRQPADRVGCCSTRGTGRVLAATRSTYAWAALGHATFAYGLGAVNDRERDLADEISALKREPGKDTLMIAGGGTAFAQLLTRLRLVDEYRLVLQPVALGDGLPLFAGSPPFVLDLIEARAYADGAVLHIYRPAAG